MNAEPPQRFGNGSGLTTERTGNVRSCGLAKPLEPCPSFAVKWRATKTSISTSSSPARARAISSAQWLDLSSEPRLLQIQFVFELVQEFLAELVLAIQGDELFAFGLDGSTPQTAALDGELPCRTPTEHLGDIVG